MATAKGYEARKVACGFYITESMDKRMAAFCRAHGMGKSEFYRYAANMVLSQWEANIHAQAQPARIDR